MSLFTERNGLRKPVEKTFHITEPMYSVLYDSCEKYLIHLAYLFPRECKDGRGCYDIDRKKLEIQLTVEIPDLFRDSNGYSSKPEIGECEVYDQYALLDYIEYLAKKMRDYQERDFHSFFGHTHINFLKSDNCFDDFRDEINSVFQKTGLQYILTDNKCIERIVDNNAVFEVAEEIVRDLKEQGAKDLIKEALQLYKSPRPESRRDAMEKIWDAFERVKTYYTDLNKKQSTQKIIKDIADGNDAYCELIEKEYRELTDIGNTFRIRHHETDKINITNPDYYDYFFERCLALVMLSVKYLE